MFYRVVMVDERPVRDESLKARCECLNSATHLVAVQWDGAWML